MNLEVTTKRLEQVVLEDEYSRSNIRARVKSDVLKSINKKLRKRYKKCVKHVRKYQIKEYYKSKEKRVAQIRPMDPEDIVTELVIAVIQTKKHDPIQNTAARLGRILDHDDVFDSIKTAAEIITVCSESNLYDLYSDPITIKRRFKLPKKTRRFIENTRYINPMLCKPDNWHNNIDGGYISVCQNVVLGKVNRHKDKQALDAINTVQQIAWELDLNILKYKEKSKKPLNTKKQRIAWKQHTKMSRRVYKELKDQGNEFWFVWRYDFRGRMYSQGHYVNLQSTDYKKALLNFKHKELIKCPTT